ncbi:MAG: tape measure protein [Hyphomicrobiaceae bacterium]|nr:tape measure protein [Hyphomicrobiaceae bacterium]
MSGGLGGLRGTLTTVAAGFGVILGAAGIGGFVSKSLEASSSVNSFNAALTSITGSSSTAKDALGWVNNEANRLAVDLSSARDGFKNYAASALLAGQDMDQVKQTFSGVSTAARVLNLSADDTSGVFRALSQIASKGVVQMEELRGQIGDRMPGAIDAMARALGVGKDQLFEMVKAGKVGADILPKFGEELAKTFGPGLAQALNTPEAQMQRLSNTMTQVASSFGTNFFTPLKDGFKALSDVFSSERMIGTIQGIASALGELATGFVAGFAGAFDVLGRVSEALSNAYNNVVSFLQNWGLLSEGFTAANAAGDKTASTLKVVGVMLAGLAIAGTIAAGVSLLSTAFSTAAVAATALARGIAFLMVSGGPITLLLTGLAAAGVVVAAKMGLFEKAMDKVKGVMPDTSAAIAGVTGTSDQLKESMSATLDKTQDFTTAQEKLSKGFETVQASATQLPGAMGQLQATVSTLTNPLEGVAKSSGSLGLAFSDLRESAPATATGFANLQGSVSALAEPLNTLNQHLLVSGPAMTSLATSTPVFTGALSSMTVPDLSGFAASITSIASQAEPLARTKDAMGEFVGYVSASIDQIRAAAVGVERLAIAGTSLAGGFSAATEAGGTLVAQMSSVESGAASLEAQMRSLEAAARDALRAAQAAQSGGGGTVDAGSGRYGGLSESLPESLTAPMDKFNNAPAFADGTANTSRQLSKLPGGGIPSILHPNEAVIPLSRGRKVPVDLNLALTAPAPTNIDMSGVADALTMVADTQGRLANSLAQDTAVTIQNTWTGVGFSKPTGNAFVGSFGNPADLSMRGSAAGGSTSQRADSPSATSATGSGVTVVIAEGAIQVHASDLDGFKRSEDQLARGLAEKIKRATRRVQ